ncbi:hypothetical protein [Achromobacter anxifer]|uniref:hypothetical protein n=1 Tax=Achromobacter anxifer TaxID=1287737 RepID=UPI0015925301|nr:hypothetical protein [Achromobacter anxifer]
MMLAASLASVRTMPTFWTPPEPQAPSASAHAQASSSARAARARRPLSVYGISGAIMFPSG